MNTKKLLIFVILFSTFISACGSADGGRETVYEPLVVEKEGKTVTEHVEGENPSAEEPMEEESVNNHSLPLATASGAIAQQPLATPLPTMAPPGEVESPKSPDAMFFDDYGVNPFVDAYEDHLSTFALDVDTASYSVARRYVNDGNVPPAEAIRVEEFVNYFDPGYPTPAG